MHAEFSAGNRFVQLKQISIGYRATKAKAIRLTRPITMDANSAICQPDYM